MTKGKNYFETVNNCLTVKIIFLKCRPITLTSKGVPKFMVHPDNIGIPQRTTVFGIASNRNFISEEAANGFTWETCTDPKWTGKMAMDDLPQHLERLYPDDGRGRAKILFRTFNLRCSMQRTLNFQPILIRTHPKGRRAAFLDGLRGSARVHGHAFGHRRSGVIHTSIGAGVVNNTYKIIRHIDQYFTTFIADGKKIIDRGHLLALDDPEVHKVAEKYGAPKALLTEDWIPAVSVVNV